MKNKKLVLLGGGGHCRSVVDAIIKSIEYADIVITDPDIPGGTDILGVTVVGSDEMLPKLYREGFRYAFITVGSIRNSGIRKRLAEFGESVGFSFPVIMDPSAVVSKSAVIGNGTFVGKNAVVNTDSRIGKHCIINTGAIIEHECVVEDYTHVSVGTILCGNCVAGRESFIGAGATVIQGRKIGSKTIIGANSIVLSDVEDNMKVYGIVNGNPGGGQQQIE